MAISKKIEKFLNESKVKYEPIEHKTVFTAYDKAQTLKVPEKIIGKTLTVKLDKNYGLVLIPANKMLDKKKLLKIANKCLTPEVKHKIRSVDFVKEVWIKKNLKGVKIGAVPPFGNLWKMPTIIDRSLMNQPKIILNAGDWNWSIKINPAILKKVIQGLIIGNISKAK